MSGVEPPGAQDSLKPVAPRSMQRPSSQMGAGGLPSAAEIWSTQAEAPAPPSKPAEQPATEKVLHGPEPAEAPKLGSIWQNSAWQKRRLAESRSWPPRRLSLALQGGGSFGAFTWGVLERLLEEPDCDIDAISGASAGSRVRFGRRRPGRRADETARLLAANHGSSIVPFADVDRGIFTGPDLP